VTWEAVSGKVEETERRAAEGFVYVLFNSYDPDRVKIGCTTRTSRERAKEVGGSTGVAGRFAVVHEELVPDCFRAEKRIHDKLKAHRGDPRREFFWVPIELAIKTVREIAADERTRAATAEAAAAAHAQIVAALAAAPTEAKPHVDGAPPAPNGPATVQSSAGTPPTRRWRAASGACYALYWLCAVACGLFIIGYVADMFTKASDPNFGSTVLGGSIAILFAAFLSAAFHRAASTLRARNK
jgi:hypothetical protein